MRNPITHLLNAGSNSLRGLLNVARNEYAFQFELFLSLFIIPLAFYLGHTRVEKALLLGSWLLILIIELVNSAIETTIDRISFEKNELSGRAKDIGSAAVFLCMANAFLIWVIILF